MRYPHEALECRWTNRLPMLVLTLPVARNPLRISDFGLLSDFGFRASDLFSSDLNRPFGTLLPARIAAGAFFKVNDMASVGRHGNRLDRAMLSADGATRAVF